ncbi:MAG TPA: hypothetical protein VKA08_02805 [Balneolales bacterium]|nr:hypothetical protein [Balneolales bacterium]
MSRKRKAVIIKRSNDGKRCIAIDVECADGIRSYINQDKRHRKKFDFICRIILLGLRNTELYDKEEPDDESKGIRAMKFFKGQENDRIYCKEITLEDKTFVVIASELHEKKKSRKLTHKEISIIHRVAGYDYEEFYDY